MLPENKILGAVIENEADFTQMLCRIHICADNNGKILQSVKLFPPNSKDVHEKPGLVSVCVKNYLKDYVVIHASY